MSQWRWQLVRVKRARRSSADAAQPTSRNLTQANGLLKRNKVRSLVNMWSMRAGHMRVKWASGLVLQLPMTSMTHHYFVTDTVPEFEGLDQELPVIRDDKLVSGYIRMEQKKGLIGIYEKENPNAVWLDECPWDAENELFAPDYDRVMPYLENALDRMPIFAELGISRDVHGAISHPPDGNPLIGPAPGVTNYWCCCGTQIGIGWGPGLTRELAKWMLHGSADISMRDYDPRRFGDYANKEWQVIKAKEDYCLRHEIPFPSF